MAINIKGRNENRWPTQKKILIVCEGEKTEPSYFNSFRVAKDICDVRGLGVNTNSLVQKAQVLAKKNDYKEVWCVFDRDSFPRKNVDAAFRSASKFGFKCAFSNESFELWYILHFSYLDSQLSRQDYCERLSKLLNIPYKKNNSCMYEILLDRQANAIKNAELLERAMCGHGVSLLLDRSPRFIIWLSGLTYLLGIWVVASTNNSPTLAHKK